MGMRGFNIKFDKKKDEDGNDRYYVNEKEVTKEEYKKKCDEFINNPIKFFMDLNYQPVNVISLNQFLERGYKTHKIEVKQEKERPCDIFEFEGLLNIITEASEGEYDKIRDKEITFRYYNTRDILAISDVNFPVNLHKYLPFKDNLDLYNITFHYQNGVLEIKIPIKKS